MTSQRTVKRGKKKTVVVYKSSKPEQDGKAKGWAIFGAVMASILLLSATVLAINSYAGKPATGNSDSLDICASLLVNTNIGQTIPDYLGNEHVGFYDLNGNYAGYIQITDGAVSEVSCQDSEHEDFHVYVRDGKLLAELFSVTSPKPILEAQKEGLVYVDGTSFSKDLKKGTVVIGAKAASWFF